MEVVVDSVRWAWWCVCFSSDTSSTEIYSRSYTLALHDARPSYVEGRWEGRWNVDGWMGREMECGRVDGKGDEYTGELQSHYWMSYGVCGLKRNMVVCMVAV